MDINHEKKFIELLCGIKGLNGRTGMELINRFGCASAVVGAEEALLTNLLPPSLVRAVLDLSERAPKNSGPESGKEKISFVSFFEESYPRRLKEIPDAPLGIWYIGNLPQSNTPSVAVIGARQCSAYGEHIARTLGEYLGKMGVNVISGMAIGIDGISQSAALQSGGSSYAVLGCGADICYPASNRGLYEKLPEKGGIISSYAPGEPALPANFPPRNRIVSGLSDAVVVIEARQRSGTLITVDMALEQGREVFAVPGRITDRLSDGCNALIGQGANVILSPEIFIGELQEICAAKASAGAYESRGSIIPHTRFSKELQKLHKNFSGDETAKPGLTGDEKKVWEKVTLTPRTIDEICMQLADMDYTTVSLILMQLLISGHIRQVSQGCYIRN